MVVVIKNTKKTELWHCRLRLMSKKEMKLLVNDGKIPKLKSVDHHLSESCVLGKKRRISFSIGRRELKHKRLELVHADVWGPTIVPSLRRISTTL